MITNLNSWSFEPSSNKSVDSFGPSIPAPSHGHTAPENPRRPFYLSSSLGTWDFLGAWHLVFGNCPYSLHFRHIPSPNPLISRVFTPFHVNQYLFCWLPFPSEKHVQSTKKHITRRRPAVTGAFSSCACSACSAVLPTQTITKPASSRAVPPNERFSFPAFPPLPNSTTEPRQQTSERTVRLQEYGSTVVGSLSDSYQMSGLFNEVKGKLT
jgi:hypothetical protein